MTESVTACRASRRYRRTRKEAGKLDGVLSPLEEVLGHLLKTYGIYAVSEEKKMKIQKFDWSPNRTPS